MTSNANPVNEYILTNMLPEDGVASIRWPIAIANNLQYLAQEPKHVLSMRGNKNDYNSYLLTGTYYTYTSKATNCFFVQFSGDFPDNDFIATFSIDDFEMIRWTQASELAEWLDPSYDPDTSLRRKRYTSLVPSVNVTTPNLTKISYSVIVPVVSPLIYIDNVHFDVWRSNILSLDYVQDLV